jgi:hypothetical protein
VAKGRIGTWDPIMFGLLVVDSFFTAFTALLLVTVVCGQLGSYTVGSPWRGGSRREGRCVTRCRRLYG